MTRALNLGCGDKIFKPGQQGFHHWVHADVRALVHVDVVCDFRQPLPFDDGFFDHIHADNVLEHFVSEDLIRLINECDRILKPFGTFRVIVPHFQSQGAVQDPTHKSFFVPRSFLYWNQVTTPHGGRAVGITANFKTIQEPVVVGDMATEAFIEVLLQKC